MPGVSEPGDAMTNVMMPATTLAPKQVKWIHNGLCFLTGDIGIPKVYLPLCYIVSAAKIKIKNVFGNERNEFCLII